MPPIRMKKVSARPGAPAMAPAANRYHGNFLTRAHRRPMKAGSTGSQREGGA